MQMLGTKPSGKTNWGTNTGNRKTRRGHQKLHKTKCHCRLCVKIAKKIRTVEFPYSTITVFLIGAWILGNISFPNLLVRKIQQTDKEDHPRSLLDKSCKWDPKNAWTILVLVGFSDWENGKNVSWNVEKERYAYRCVNCERRRIIRRVTRSRKQTYANLQ